MINYIKIELTKLKKIEDEQKASELQ
jgi:hypothetical protein